jgi:hypothetical protein
MSFPNQKQMVVALLINDEEMKKVTLLQHNDRNPNWFEGRVDIDEAHVHIRVGGKANGKETEIECSFRVDLYEMRGGLKPVKNSAEWESVSWDMVAPKRPTFPGEPALPRTTMKVALQMVSAPRKRPMRKR